MNSRNNTPQPFVCKGALSGTMSERSFGPQIVQQMDIASIRGRIAEASDPLLGLINRLREAFEHCEKLSRVLGDDDFDFDRLVQASIDPLLNRIANRTPVPTTEAGALEALRFLIEQEKIGTYEAGMTTGVLTAVLAFFEGRAVR